jgi:hypothetical protein
MLFERRFSKSITCSLHPPDGVDYNTLGTVAELHYSNSAPSDVPLTPFRSPGVPDRVSVHIKIDFAETDARRRRRTQNIYTARLICGGATCRASSYKYKFGRMLNSSRKFVAESLPKSGQADGKMRRERGRVLEEIMIPPFGFPF